jgi:hypothetical protein
MLQADFGERAFHALRCIGVRSKTLRLGNFGANRSRSRDSDPTPHLRLVAQVLFAELALQVVLLALDDAAPYREQRDRQQQDGL